MIKKELKEGNIYCNKCGGTGWYHNGQTYINNGKLFTTCSKCYGKGQIDWIENIVGVKYPLLIYLN